MRGVFQKKLKRRQNLSQSISNEMAISHAISNGLSNALSNWKAGSHNHLFSRMSVKLTTYIGKKAVALQNKQAKSMFNIQYTLEQAKAIKLDELINKGKGIKPKKAMTQIEECIYYIKIRKMEYGLAEKTNEYWEYLAKKQKEEELMLNIKKKEEKQVKWVIIKKKKKVKKC
jgi:hypothetical protein